MEKIIVADVNPLEVRIALLENGQLCELQIERRERERLVGNIYKGRVANVLPGMQAAFIDIGLKRNAFLYAGDILADKSDFEFNNISDNISPTQDIAPNISEMLKVGQDIMVQVLKQPGGNKGARVTTHITLPGRSLVLMPTVNHIGVSRKIEHESERERLRKEVERIAIGDMGVIIRTAGEGQHAQDFVAEIEFLKKLWGRVNKRFKLLSAPRLLHAEESLIFRTVRDMLGDDISKFVINNKEYFEKVQAVANIIAPGLSDKIEYFDAHYDIFTHYDISAKVNRILGRKVWLKCGGYLIIDETEALTVVDVNTGKYVGDNDLQNTILSVNLEAAEEIAKQLRLRDVSGIIVIDFIDMEREENREKVLECLKNALKNDRTKTNVLGITGLGLVEMTRKKVRRKLSTLTKRECPLCGGQGMVDNLESVVLSIRREVIRALNETSFNEFLIYLHPEIEAFFSQRKDICEDFKAVIGERKLFLKPKEAQNVCEFKLVGVSDKELREEMKESFALHQI